MALPIQKKPQILTQRLVLKPYSSVDESALAHLFTNPQITETFMVPDFQSLDEARTLAKKIIGFSQIENTTHLEYGIYRKNQLIGFINDCGIKEDEIEIGYVIAPDFQGFGFATEAVRAVLRELRDMGFRKVTAGFFEENIASFRVMEKLGMKQTSQVEEETYRGTTHRCRYCEIIL